MLKTIIKNTLKNIIRAIIKHFPPYYIIMVDGGLGSQIFKYALGTAIAEKTGAKIYYDLSWFSQNGMDINNKYTRKYEIDKVFANLKMETPAKLLLTLTHFANCYCTKTPHIYDDYIFNNNNLYLDSYFANINYFYEVRPSLLKDFVFADTFSKFKLKEYPNCVAVHIRQGDYVNSIHDVVTPKYFINAINYFINTFDNCYFYIFCTSDNYFKDYLVNKLPSNLKYEIITNPDENGAVDMYRMSECKHFIISNSSFSLFPAWLNKNNGTVIMPSKWHKTVNTDMTKGSDKAFILKNAIIMEV